MSASRLALAQAITAQFHAALAMFEETVRRCPDALWLDPDGHDPFWRIAYHTLFYTHLYLADSAEQFSPWPRHRADYQYLGPIAWDGNRLPAIGEPYTQADLLDYAAFCREEVATRLAATDFSAPSGFDWLPMDKLELQLYTLRHLALHIGELGARLSAHGIAVRWLIKAEDA